MDVVPRHVAQDVDRHQSCQGSGDSDVDAQVPRAQTVIEPEGQNWALAPQHTEGYRTWRADGVLVPQYTEGYRTQRTNGVL